MVAVVGWPDVFVALIAGLPAIIGALAALSVRQSVKTPSGTTIGKQVEGAQHTALANHYLLRAAADEIGVTPPSEVARETQHVQELNGETRDSG